MPQSIRPLIAAVAIAAVTSTSAFSDDLLPTIEGIWKGQMSVGGMIGTLDVELTATDIGGLLTFKRHFLSCKYAFAPKEKDHKPEHVYERFLISERGGKCSQGDIGISVKDGTTISLELLKSEFPITVLQKVSGTVTRKVNVPAVEILGFTLNDRLEDLAKTTGAPVAVVSVPRSQTRGMRGDLSSFAKADMTQAEWRVSSSGKLKDVAYDIVAAYRFKSDDIAGAIARVWLPDPQDARP